MTKNSSVYDMFYQSLKSEKSARQQCNKNILLDNGHIIPWICVSSV